MFSNRFMQVSIGIAALSWAAVQVFTVVNWLVAI